MSTELTLTLSPSLGDKVKVKTKNLDDGTCTVSYKAVADVLRAVATQNAKSRYYSVHELPEGTVSAQINGNGKHRIVVKVNGRKRPFLYYDDEYLIPMPDMVFALAEDGGKFMWLEVDGNAYIYPFGNVSANGSICYGGNKLESIDSFMDFQKWIDAFLFSKTNDDYYSSKQDSHPMTTGSESHRASQREMLAMLQDMDTYPKEWLKPFKNWTKGYDPMAVFY